MKAEAHSEVSDPWEALQRARARLRAAVLPRDMLRVLRTDFRMTQGVIAAACGTTDRSVRNWEAGTLIRRRAADRLSALADVVLILSETVVPPGIEQWLWARVRLLGGERPVDLFARDQGHRVGAAARAFVEGTHV